MALKKVALRRLEDGIPNQALREIRALQEIEDNQHVGLRGQRSPRRDFHSCLSSLQDKQLYLLLVFNSVNTSEQKSYKQD